MPVQKERKEEIMAKRIAVYVPGLPHERMVRADMGLTFDDVEPRTPYPFFAQCQRKRVRVDKRATRRVDEHGVLLHLAQESRVDDVVRALPAGRKHEEHVARARELVELYAPDGA